jgi:hypothetical protein
MLRLISISDCSLSTSGLISNAAHCVRTNIPMLAIFWRVLTTSGFASLMASVTKIRVGFVPRVDDVLKLSCCLQ